MPSRRRTEIEKEKIVLVEGADAYFFFIWACQAFGVDGIQVIDFGGINDLGKYLETFKGLPGYEKVSTVVIGRDAENDPEGAIKSIKSALKKNGFAAPQKPYFFTKGHPRVAYVLFPGFESDENSHSLLSGTLEDLCLSTTEDDEVHTCVDIYVDCLNSKGIEIQDLHKTRLHAYLAGKKNFAGLKIGEAAKAGAWDWSHVKLKPFKKIIEAM